MLRAYTYSYIKILSMFHGVQLFETWDSAVDKLRTAIDMRRFKCN